MKTKALIPFTLLLVLLGASLRTARAQERADGMRFLPDVVGQFQALTEHPEVLGFHRGGAPDPSACKHNQAVVRVDGPDGTPFFLVTRSGNDPESPPSEFCDDSPGENGLGHLTVFRMASRDKNGERLRSNRLGPDVVDFTPPPEEDAASIFYTVTEDGLVFQNGEGGTPPRTYQHPGGMQVVGHMLAMAAEHPCQLSDQTSDCEPTTRSTMIFFFDVTDPEHPVLKSKFSPQDQVGDACGVVGITPLPSGLNLMVVTGGKNEVFYFYRSTLSDLSSEALDWDFIGTTPGVSVADAHQTLHFLRQGDINGPLFLAGARGYPLRDDVLFENSDRIDLYGVFCENVADCGEGAQIGLTTVVSDKRITATPTTFGSYLANLAAASGFYVSPSSELLFYAVEHDNDGPGRTFKAGEWRHADVVRGDSPTLLPHAILSNPYLVDEGANATLTGSAEPPVTRAFIQLFLDRDFANLCPVVDFDDRDLDEYDKLGRYCGYNDIDEDGFRSASWFAPEGCSITTDHTFLGGRKTLDGTGSIVHFPDLRDVLNDAGTGDLIRSVNRVEFKPNCDSYYQTPVSLEWDLDRNGSFETTGTQVPFSASALDGPLEVSLPVQARHPDSTVPGPAVATVLVRNVAPDVGAISLTDGAGNVVPSQVPFVLTDLPLEVQASFLDPGLPDHQTAVISWGDGASDSQGAFESFDEAFGDGSGAAAASHAYSAPGTFAIALSVTDDDGGADSSSAQVDVLTVEQALEVAIDLLTDEITATSNPVIRKILEKAEKALSGNPQAQNGARQKIQHGNDHAAIAFLNQAIRSLQEASQGGADVAILVAILQQLVVALSAGL